MCKNVAMVVDGMVSDGQVTELQRRPGTIQVIA